MYIVDLYSSIAGSLIRCYISVLKFHLFKKFVQDPTLVGEENEAFFIRVSKPLPSSRVFKTLRGSSKGKTQRGQYLLVVGLGHYKWYQSQTRGDVSTRRLSPEGCGHEAVCWQGRWGPKGVNWGGPTSIGERNECK